MFQKKKEIFKLIRYVFVNHPKMIRISLLEVFCNAGGIYLPMGLLVPFLQALLSLQMNRLVFWGVLYFTTLAFFKISERVISGKRIFYSRKIGEEQINSIHEKVNTIHYEKSVDENTKRLYNTAIEELMYEFDYADVIDVIVNALQYVLQIILSVSLTMTLLFSQPQKKGAIWWLVDPRGAIISFCLVSIGLLYMVIHQTGNVAIQKNQLIQDHARIENQLAYLQNEIVYRFPYYISYQMFGMEKMLNSRFEENQNENLKYFSTSRRCSMKVQNYHDISTMIFTFFAFSMSIIKSVYHAIPASTVVTYIQSMQQLHTAAFSLVSIYGRLIQAVPYFHNIEHFLAYPNEEVTEFETEKMAFPEEPYTIQIEHVSYRYPGAKEDALHDISLTLYGSKKYALVGENGSGKTTLILLLCRLLEPTQGSIMLNGIDITRFPLKEYREKISCVMQDYGIYPISVRENVTLSETYRLKQFEDTVNVLHIRKLLNLSYNKDEGPKCSNGEKQKLCIARSLYRETPIQILDEPTSALDPMSEKKLFQAILDQASKKTVLFVSHRMSSTRECDGIFVLDHGKLIEKGTHNELMLNKKKYYQLWSMQAEHFKAEIGLKEKK